MRILFSSSKTKTVKAQGMYVGVGSFIQHPDHTHNSSTALLPETGYSTKCCCFVILNPFTYIYDLVPKGAQEKRTEVLENKVDRM